MQLFSADAKIFLKSFKKVFLAMKTKKMGLKLMAGSFDFFFSAAPTDQNSPELNFCFINSFIQSSRVGSQRHSVLEND